MMRKKKMAWKWIPSLYFAEGIPYVVVMTVAVIMYKRMGISNTEIALYTSWLYLPWVIKPFWSPFVDIMKTKRWWIVAMQLLIGASLGGIALFIPAPFYFQATLALFWLLAFSAATHDIAADGFYMLGLDSSEQSFFVGIRSTFYRFAMIAGQGLLVLLAGALETTTGLPSLSLHVVVQQDNGVAIIPDSTTQSVNNETQLMAYPSTVVVNPMPIMGDSVRKIVDFVNIQNRLNGFTSQEESGKIETKTAGWWEKSMSTPIGNWIKKYFGEERMATSDNSLVGNIGIFEIGIKNPPTEEEEIVVNTHFISGNKSVMLIAGERLVFSPANYHKRAYIVVQLDKRLTAQTSATFSATSGNLKLAWSLVFYILLALFISLFIYHKMVLPYPHTDIPATRTPAEIIVEFKETFVSFFTKKGFGIALAFMLLYRLGEAMLVKMSSPFLLDGSEAGGLALTTGDVGVVYGTVGMLALTLGGIVGGIASSRQGLKYWIMPMALSITLPNAVYLYLAIYLPDNMWIINIAIAIEQFGYGFGFTAYMLYLIYFAQGIHKTAHYAICTGFMALGMMLPGMIAGWLQEQIGYAHFFVFVLICSIPILVLVPFLRIDRDFGRKKGDEKRTKTK